MHAYSSLPHNRKGGAALMQLEESSQGGVVNTTVMLGGGVNFVPCVCVCVCVCVVFVGANRLTGFACGIPVAFTAGT